MSQQPLRDEILQPVAPRASNHPLADSHFWGKGVFLVNSTSSEALEERPCPGVLHKQNPFQTLPPQPRASR